jgi:hypothetical protein
MGFFDCKIGQRMLGNGLQDAQAHVWPVNGLSMQNSLREKSYAGYDNAGSCGRETLLYVKNHSIEQCDLHTCRRNTLEAIAQLASMWELN